MHPSTAVSNPFALMVEPEMVFAALERSDRLARLKSTICRPLDNPRPEKPVVGLNSFDAEVEAAVESFEQSFESTEQSFG